MQLTKEIADILKNFSQINTSILFKPGNVLMTKSNNNAIYAEAVIGTDIDVEVGIYNIPQVLQIAGILGETQISCTPGDDQMLLTDGKKKFKLKLADPSTIVAPKKQLNFPVADVIFDLPGSMMDEIKKSAAALGVNVLSFESVGDQIVAIVLGENADNDATFPVAGYDGNHDFVFQMDIGNVKIMDGDYKVLISSKGAIKFEGQTVPVNYIMPLNAGCKYQERD